jgi:putative ABC transport system substrate-binding protein
MRRRDFVSLLGGAAAWPIAARAQQRSPIIGFVWNATGQTPSEVAPYISAFHDGLRRIGFVEGQNVAVEYSVGAQTEQLPTLIAELVHRQVGLIVGNTPPAIAAKAATSTIPIVFFTGTDPVRVGLVSSFNRPGGNITGMSFLTAELEAKRLGLLHDLLPRASVVTALVDPSFVTSAGQLRDLEGAAPRLHQQISVLHASTESELVDAFAILGQRRPDALIVTGVPFFTSRRDKIIELAARLSLPVMYNVREFPASGGLISYGASLVDALRQVGVYAGRILKGEKPADLPVLLPTKFDLVINLNTAKALGLEIPPTVRALADEVIE